MSISSTTNEAAKVDMRERPILFSAPMVRALLAGTKTQTRRVAKFKADQGLNLSFTGLEAHRFGESWCLLSRGLGAQWEERSKTLCSPYGLEGDQLWVRESWGYFDPDGTGEDFDRDKNDDGKSGPCKVYAPELMQEGHPLRDYWRRRVTYAATWNDAPYGKGPDGPKRWRPSIHMPRWASRIQLEVTGLRIERLWGISDADVRAEGCEGTKLSYAKLWESINGAGSWDANPWVWVIEFRRLKP